MASEAASPPGSAPLRIHRYFVRVGARTVHYRRAGSGPPVVLVHGSPANSAVVEPEMRRLAGAYTCFAFDTPGFGDSDGLAELTEGIGSLADALAETLRAMNFPSCPVFGTHTGAAIALELARRHPQSVTGAVLDGVPMYTAEEQVSLFSGYFEPLVVDDLGSQFARTWTRFRDLFIWFPWTTKTPATLNETDRPTAELLQLWVSMFYRSARSYGRPYKAAIAYGSQAREAIESLRAPAVFMANDRDMLYPHLERIPPLREGQSICRVTRAQHGAAITTALARFASSGAPPADVPLRFTAGESTRQYVDQPHAQVLVRLRGSVVPGEHPTVVLLHDAPGSGRVLESVMAALPATVNVVAPDLPGCGESEGFQTSQPAMAEFAQVVLDVLDRLGLKQAALYGRGFGASVAAELGALAPERVSALIVHGACLPGQELRERMQREYAPRIRVEDDGAHWYRTWLMLRDALVYFPWFDGRREALRRVDASFDAQRLHDLTFDVLKQPYTWHQLIEACLRHDLAARLRGRRPPTLVLEDPSQPFAAFDATLRGICPQAKTRVVTDDLAVAAQIAGHLGV